MSLTPAQRLNQISTKFIHKLKIHPLLWYCFASIQLPSNYINRLQTHTDNFLNKALVHLENPTRKRGLINRDWYYTPRNKGGLGLRKIADSVHVMRLRQLQTLLLTMFITPSQRNTPHHYLPGIDNLRHALPPWFATWDDILFAHPGSMRKWSGIKWNRITEWWQDVIFHTPIRSRLALSHPAPTQNWPIWNNRFILHRNQVLMKSDNVRNREMIHFWATHGITHLRHVYGQDGILTPTQLWDSLVDPIVPPTIDPSRLIQYTKAILQKIGTAVSQIYRELDPCIAARPAPPWPVWCVPLHDEMGITRPSPLLSIHKSMLRLNLLFIPLQVKLLEDAAKVLRIPNYPITMNYWHQERQHSTDLLPFFHDIIWRLQRNGLPTGHKYQWSPEINSMCQAHCTIVETPRHLFWVCPLSSYSWSMMCPPLNRFLNSPLTWQHTVRLHDLEFRSTIQPNTRMLVIRLWNIVRACTIHTIWMNRNSLTFDENKGSRDPHTLFEIMRDKVAYHLRAMTTLSADLKTDMHELMRGLGTHNISYLPIWHSLANSNPTRRDHAS